MMFNILKFNVVKQFKCGTYYDFRPQTRKFTKKGVDPSGTQNLDAVDGLFSAH